MSDSQPDSGQAATPSQRPLTPALQTAIGRIRERWADQREHWDGGRVEEVHQALHDLAAAAEQEEFPALAEAAFNAEVYLSSFVGMDTPMTPSQREEFDALLGGLPMDVAEVPQTDSPAPSSEIHVLGDIAGPVGQVADALREGGFTVHLLEHPDQAVRALHMTPPAALVADIADAHTIEPVIEELARIHQETGRHIPLAYVAESGDLETRVKAVRAGGDAFYSPPFDSTQMLERLQSLIDLHRPQESHKVLVVEDDQSQAAFAASILGKAGMQTETVTDPMAVLEHLREFRPDLILMDIYMPEVNGIELTTVIREYDEFVDIPIVFLSGEQDADKQVDALSVGGDDFITKPIRPRQLIAVVENRLRRSQLRSKGKRGQETTPRTLNQAQFVDRLGAVLATDPMHIQTTAIMMMAPDRDERLVLELGEDAKMQLYAQIVESLSQELSPEDSIALLDGASIAVLARRSTANLVNDLASRLRQRVAAQSYQVDGQELSISASIGIAFADNSQEDTASLINQSRLALQYALNEGPDKTVAYDEEFEALLASGVNPSVKEDDITRNIRQCLKDDSFVLLYQPMLDLVERGTETWELQLRMPTPTGELLARRDFREEAEKADLALDIDRWVLSQALDTLKRRNEKSGRKTRLFVIQSADAATHPEYADWLSEELRERRMVGTGLVLEFRLSSLSHDLKAAKGNIRQLRDMDIQVSLSHFAEKPAAFKVLRYVRGRFIRVAPRLLTADRDTINMIIGEAHKSGARVIVSGIDDPRAIDLHWSSGADLLQGDFIQRPLESMDYDFTQVVI